ncbi:MAG: hypothetical protein M3394_04445 [Actinomycetota bacterium]|nr:hypothetical protein [Actinomycetota bacterium]
MDVGVAETDEQRDATYRFLDDEIGAQHALLLDGARAMDTKATVVAGFAAAAISFLLNTPREALWWVALCLYGLSFGGALAAMWPRHWEGLSPSVLQQELADASPVFVVGQVAGSKAVVFERNQVRIQHKVVLWTASVVLLGGGTAFSAWSTISEVPR